MKPDLLSIAPLVPRQMARMADRFTIHPLPGGEADQGQLLARIGPGLRFLQTTGFNGAGTDLLRQFPELEIVSCMGVGVDAIDLKYAKEHAIAVTNTPDVLNDDVADLGITLTLMAARHLALSDRWVRAGDWITKGNQPLATKASGKTLGILGLGRIGKAIARRAAAFDMTICYHGRKPQPDQPYRYYADLADMAKDVDFLIAICPGGPATRHIVNARVLEALGPDGIFINVSRGSVVDEAALIAALATGKLGGAALDVFADEPRVPDPLRAMDNVVLAPHVGSATHETRDAMCALVVDNLIAQLDGKKLLTRVV